MTAGVWVVEVKEVVAFGIYFGEPVDVPMDGCKGWRKGMNHDPVIIQA